MIDAGRCIYVKLSIFKHAVNIGFVAVVNEAVFCPKGHSSNVGVIDFIFFNKAIAPVVAMFNQFHVTLGC